MPFACFTGEASSMNSTPSSIASSSSSRSAGIYLRLRRYTSVTFSTPSARFAARAASIAVFPPPTTATFLPSFSSPPFLKAYRKSITFITLPSILRRPFFSAPQASTM